MANMCSLEAEHKETAARCPRCGVLLYVSLPAILIELLADLAALKSALRDKEKQIAYYRDNFELCRQQER